MYRKLVLGLSAVALVAGLGYGGATLASAQDSSSTTTRPSTEAPAPADHGGRPAVPGGHCNHDSSGSDSSSSSSAQS